MLSIFKNLFSRNYQPLNIIEISEKNLIKNYKYLSSINRQVKIAPVLKSNAYGHGLVPVAKVLEKLAPPFLCVDSLYEAYELTNNGIKTPVLIMGFVDPLSLKTKKLPYSFAVYNYEQLEALDKYQPQAKIHIFVDTGMHREGIPMENLDLFLEKIRETSLQIEGAMSHFGESENPKNPLTKQQQKRFSQIAKSINAKWTHISNSGGALGSFGIGNIARVGLGLYGIQPGTPVPKLKPALSLKTHIAQINDLKRGESVGYGFTYKAKKDMKIAILPLGYYDGVDRRLSNKGYVYVRNTECRIIGRVSMNITTIDISNIKQASVGDEVVVYSTKPHLRNSVQNAASICQTIPYELLAHLASSTRRVVR